MRNTTKIQEFIETLSALIQAGAPGFLDRLPSRRELAAQYGISPASVQIALQELEKRGLVTNYPQKGSRVNPRPGCNRAVGGHRGHGVRKSAAPDRLLARTFPLIRAEESVLPDSGAVLRLRVVRNSGWHPGGAPPAPAGQAAPRGPAE